MASIAEWGPPGWSRDGCGPPRLVHRLDRDTSGCLALALTRPAATRLSAAFAAGATGQQGSRPIVKKVYWACVKASLRSNTRGVINLPLSRLVNGGVEKMGPDRGGSPAVTAWRLVASSRRGPRLDWIEFEPRTGRKHQIRAHAAATSSLGPLYGDGKFGWRHNGPGAPPRLHLHCHSLRLPRGLLHPDADEVHATAPLPDHMQATWERAGWMAAMAFVTKDDDGSK